MGAWFPNSNNISYYYNDDDNNNNNNNNNNNIYSLMQTRAQLLQLDF